MRAIPGLLSMLALLSGCGEKPRPAADAQQQAPDAPKIVLFYATPTSIARGEASNICYGTTDAAGVRLSPPVESLKPALSHCFEVKPQTTTTYTLTAQSLGGKATRTLTVKVGAAKPKPQKASAAVMIQFFLSTTPELSKGMPATLCYGVKDAAAVRIEPEGPALKVSEKSCFTVQPEKTTKYTLIAVGPSGTDKQDLTITVK